MIINPTMNIIDTFYATILIKISYGLKHYIVSELFQLPYNAFFYFVI